MAEFGLVKGLAQDLGYDQKINDLRYREQADKRAEQEAVARAKLFADDLDYNNAVNTFDAPLIKSFAQDQIKKIGEYYRNNPDVMYNPEKLAQLNIMKRELKTNPDLVRGMSVDNQYQELVKDLQEAQKNPSFHDVEALQNELGKFQNYFKTGHFGGEQYKAQEGIVPPTYTRPRNFIADLPGEIQKLGKNSQNFEVVKPKNGNIGEYYTKIPDAYLEKLTDAAIQNHGRQIDVQTRQQGIVDPEQKRDYVRQLIKSGFDKHYDIGDANALWERGMAERKLKLEKEKGQPGPSYTPFDYFTDPKVPAGQHSNDLYRKVFGDKPNIVVNGNRGAKTDLTGLDFNYDGRFVKRNGVPMLLGYVRVPLATAKSKGIITGDDDDIVNGNFSDSGARISSEYLGKAAFEKVGEPDKDGNQKTYVKVSHQLPINPNDQAVRQMFNAASDVDKLVPASSNPYKQQPVTASRQDFENAGYSNDDIERGVKEGLIKLK